ncbi:MAG: RnfABCDGE type electron transport complex subunit B [Clostridia bacterium]|nr:RnfABCDGE type electron transport complex subunit B [Clostridia bacterium]
MESFLSILIPVLAVGGLSILFGLLLAVASKIFHVHTDERIHEIRTHLPGANCGGCGYPGCDALADALLTNDELLCRCSALNEDQRNKIAEILGSTPSHTESKLAFVRCGGCNGNAKNQKKKYLYSGLADCTSASLLGGGAGACYYGCTGLGSCLKKCPFGALSLKNGVAVVDRNKCTGCGSCIAACPKGLIVLLPKTSAYAVACASLDRGVVTKSACDAGCIGCRICEKCCPEGAIRVENGLAVIDQGKCTGCGLCQNKCPRSSIVPV